MRRQSVSSGAALAFWLANPVLNPATLVFMGFVLGWPFAAIRLVAGLVMVLGIAWLVQRMTANDPQPAAPQPPLMTAERRAAVPRPLGQSAVGAVLVDHPDLRAGGAGAGGGAGLAVPARRRRRRQ